MEDEERSECRNHEYECEVESVRANSAHSRDGGSGIYIHKSGYIYRIRIRLVLSSTWSGMT